MIIAANGYHSMPEYRRALRPQGKCVVLGGTLPQIFQALDVGPLLSESSGRRIGSMGIAKRNQDDLAFVQELLATGKIQPVIDRRYPLSETG